MKTKRVVRWWCALTIISFCAAAGDSSWGQVNFFDDFSDNNIQDGSPVTWTDDDDLGTISAMDGNLLMTPTATNCCLGTRTVTNIYRDLSINLVMNYSPDVTPPDFFGATLRSIEGRPGNTYWAAISDEGELFLGHNVNGVGTTEVSGVFIGDRSVLTNDVNFQVEMRGDTIDLTAWEVGQAQPDAPQVSWTDPVTGRHPIGNRVGAWINAADDLTPTRLVSYAVTAAAIEQEVALPMAPTTIFAVRDRNFNGLGDSALPANNSRVREVGERDSDSVFDRMSRVVAKFGLPEIDRELVSAKLRFFLEEVGGTPAGPVSLYYNQSDNDLEVQSTDYQNENYTDTLKDLVQVGDAAGSYYELDVTDLVRADYANDGELPLSAFRLQVDEATYTDDGVSNEYLFGMPLHDNGPQLVLTFVPEPSTLWLALLGVSVWVLHRRNC